MSSVYEGMFLLDNAVVREDWKKAKALVTDALAKHNGSVKTARRWDERRLAYPIKGRNRGTYLMVYFEIGGADMTALRRELDLSERVLRYLMLKVDEIPAAEHELTNAENQSDFVVPTPPPDDVREPEPQPPAAEAPPSEEVLVPDLGDDALDARPRGRKQEAPASLES